jgi:hypothetical protein
MTALVTVAGEQLELHAERAVFWPGARRSSPTA